MANTTHTIECLILGVWTELDECPDLETAMMLAGSYLNLPCVSAERAWIAEGRIQIVLPDCTVI